MINIPPRATDRKGNVVRYVFWKVRDLGDDYMTKQYPEDSHIDFWVGKDPEEAPEGYELFSKPIVEE